MTSEIIWTGSPDDQTCRIGDYVLRVKLTTGLGGSAWRWVVFQSGNERNSGRRPNESKAKTACEKAYREHLKTRL